MARRKTFKKKATAKRKAHGRSIYKVKGGYRLGHKTHTRRRRKRSP